MFIKSVVFYPLLLLSTLIGYGIGGSISTSQSHNDTLKLCIEKPVECKFKYDILRYNREGIVPQPPKPIVTPQKK
jgi:hypothetical protein